MPPVNPANPNVGPQALRRFLLKARWRQPPSGQSLDLARPILVHLAPGARRKLGVQSFYVRPTVVFAPPLPPPVKIGLARNARRRLGTLSFYSQPAVTTAATFLAPPAQRRLAAQPKPHARSFLRSPPPPNLVQSHYRFRNDDGDETTATWRAAVDTVPANIPINTLFRLRVAVTETMGGDPPLHTYSLEWRQNGGAWTTTGSENSGAVVQGSTPTGCPNNTPTTQQISGGGFNPGFVQRGNNTAGIDIIPLRTLENEWTIRIGHNGGAVAGDVFDFRVISDGVVLQAYAVTPSVTVSALVETAPSAARKLAPSAQPARRSHSKLFSPSVVIAAAVAPFAPIRARLAAQPPHRKLGVRSFFTKPTVIAAADATPVPPTQVTLAPQPRPRTRSFRTRTSVPIPAVPPNEEQQQIRVRLAPQPVPKRYWFLRAPVLVNFPVPVVLQTRIAVAESIKRRLGVRSFFIRPVMVTAQAVVPTSDQQKIDVHFVPQPKQARRPIQRLRPPTVLAAPAAPTKQQQQIRILLVASPQPSRGTHYKLEPPAVVVPFIPPAPPAPQTPTVTGNFIDRRSRRTERRELFTRGRRDG